MTNISHILAGPQQAARRARLQGGYGYKKGDTKMREYIDAFMIKMRKSGKLEALITEFMRPDQIKAAN